MQSDSPFKTVINSGGPSAFSGLPPTAGPCVQGPFATHNSSFQQHSGASFHTQPFASFRTDPMHSRTSQGFQSSMPPQPEMLSQASQGSQGVVENELAVHCTVIISKLLDVPVQAGMFTTEAKTYQLRVFDHKRKELALSEEIQGLDDHELRGMTTQTFQVPEELGTLHAKTLSKTIQIQVEFSGLMGSSIGTCQINRLDLRSNKPWPYEVTMDDKVVCGVELCVVEEEDNEASSMLYSSGMGMMQLQKFMASEAVEDVQHEVSCFVELHSAKDLPKARSADLRDVVLSIMTDSGKELRQIGLFQTDFLMGNQLASVDFRDTRSFVQAPLHFGGDAQEGSQYIKIGVSYGKRSGNNTQVEMIGITDPVKVSWKPMVKDYLKLHNPDNRRLVGGIYVSHRLVTEAESAQVGDDTMKQGRVALPKLNHPLELDRRVSGRTGNFPHGSPEEAIEQAVINAEAQNRALLQRCKKEDSNSPHDFPGMRTVNGWREWENMDAIFESMGPNPLVMSEDLGPQVSRGYQHTSNIARDVAKYLPAARTPADQMLNLEMLRMQVKDDISQGESMIRPVVCKDANEIAGPQDMTWCPDPPVYVPISNLTERDKETVRLACYKPEQNASLLFVDANPNYNIREDIWGALQKPEKINKRLQNLNPPKGRVKDDCIMA